MTLYSAEVMGKVEAMVVVDSEGVTGRIEWLRREVDFMKSVMYLR